uniref:Uncharacterized protein n=1 Tax=Solanum tuberosum TaxID=4113 RepID=M1DYA0_SOLTU
MSVDGINASQLGNNDEIGNLHDVNEDQLEYVGAIRMAPAVGNVMFHVTSTMLKFKFWRKRVIGRAKAHSMIHRVTRDMARPMLSLRGPAHRKKAKGVVIAIEVTPPQATPPKPSQGSVKSKGKKQTFRTSNTCNTCNSTGTSSACSPNTPIVVHEWAESHWLVDYLGGEVVATDCVMYKYPEQFAARVKPKDEMKQYSVDHRVDRRARLSPPI